MKSTKTLLLTLALAGSAAMAQEAENSLGNRKIEMRPTEKRSLTLKPTERNPYAKRAAAKEENHEGEQNAEEIALRSRIKSLKVSGASQSSNGVRLLLGDIRVERGMVLPQLIVDQTQYLQVTDLTDEKIVLGWLDFETGELTGKTMQIPYDLSPTVRYILQGQVSADGDGPDERQVGLLKPRTRPKSGESRY